MFDKAATLPGTLNKAEQKNPRDYPVAVSKVTMATISIKKYRIEASMKTK